MNKLLIGVALLALSGNAFAAGGVKTYDYQQTPFADPPDGPATSSDLRGKLNRLDQDKVEVGCVRSTIAEPQTQ